MVKKLFRVLFIAIGCAHLLSCGGPEKPAKEDSISDSEQIRLKTRSELAARYNADLSIDTSHFRYTYQYQAVLNKNNKTILDEIILKDIAKVDSGYIISIKKAGGNLFLDLTCTESQRDSFFSVTDNYSYLSKGYFVVSISSVHRIQFTITGECETDEDGQTVNLEVEASNRFRGKGELIAFYK